MAIRQYIGARYTPRFMGTYNQTTVYEALDVVDNVQGTSYISKIPTPAGTPLTDTTHWAVYGGSSGAIINLQNQIGDLQNQIGDLTDLNTTDKDNLVDAINENVSKIDVDKIKKLSQYTSIGESLSDALNDNDISILILDEDTILTAMIEVDRTSPLYIIGNRYKVSSSKLSLIRIINGTSNLTFDNVVFEVLNYTKADNTQCNMLEVYPIDYTAIASDNIKIINCDFHGGNIAIVASYASNIVIDNCHIHDLHYPTGATSGGYGIITQVVQNLQITNNVFDNFNEGRHDIYISSMPGVTTGPMSKNIHIENNSFDHSVFNSDTLDSCAIQIRQCEEAIIEENIFKNCGRMLRLEPTNFKVTNVLLSNTIVETFDPHPTNQIDLISGGSNTLDCDIEVNNLIVKNSTATALRVLDLTDCDITGDHIVSYPVTIVRLQGTVKANITDMYINNTGYDAIYTDATPTLTGHIELNTEGSNKFNTVPIPLSFFRKKLMITNNNLINDHIVNARCIFTVSGTTFSAEFPTVNAISTPLIMASNGIVKNISVSGNTVTFKVVDDGGTELTSFNGTIEVIV